MHFQQKAELSVRDWKGTTHKPRVVSQLCDQQKDTKIYRDHLRPLLFAHTEHIKYSPVHKQHVQATDLLRNLSCQRLLESWCPQESRLSSPDQGGPTWDNGIEIKTGKDQSVKGTEDNQVPRYPKRTLDQLIKLFTAIKVGRSSNPEIQNFVSPNTTLEL